MSVVREVPVTSEGVTLSMLIWQVFKRQPGKYLTKVLEENPGLADMGAFIPAGTIVRMPLDDVSPRQASAQVVRLWD